MNNIYSIVEDETRRIMERRDRPWWRFHVTTGGSGFGATWRIRGQCELHETLSCKTQNEWVARIASEWSWVG